MDSARWTNARSDGPGIERSVSHYRQTTDFTCGPAALLMAMNAQCPAIELTRTNELQIWREANTVYMGSRLRHAGCSALGLALAARSRGFSVEVRVNHLGPLLGLSRQEPDVSEVMQLIHSQDLERATSSGIQITQGLPKADELRQLMGYGYIPLVLVSCWLLDRSRAPHWVVVTRVNEKGVLICDPWVYTDRGETAVDRTDFPVSIDSFWKMARYGSRRERAMVLIGGPDGRTSCNCSRKD